MQTTAAEVVATFAVTTQARDLLRRWQGGLARPQVPPVVLAHTTRVLYDLDPAAVEATCAASEHPLGDIRKQDAAAVAPIVDWRPDFAFTHVMHLALERLGELPTFGTFTAFCAEDPLGITALGDPARRIREQAARAGWPEAQAAHAIRWRIGLAYYSFVREAYTIAVLRDAGLDVRAHPLADALFRVDAWLDQTILSIYVRNPRFRDGAHGRKPSPLTILDGARPPFSHAELPLEPQHAYGSVHLPDPAALRTTARQLAPR